MCVCQLRCGSATASLNSEICNSSLLPLQLLPFNSSIDWEDDYSHISQRMRVTDKLFAIPIF